MPPPIWGDPIYSKQLELRKEDIKFACQGSDYQGSAHQVSGYRGVIYQGLTRQGLKDKIKEKEGSLFEKRTKMNSDIRPLEVIVKEFDDSYPRQQEIMAYLTEIIDKELPCRIANVIGKGKKLWSYDLKTVKPSYIQRTRYIAPKQKPTIFSRIKSFLFK